MVKFDRNYMLFDDQIGGYLWIARERQHTWRRLKIARAKHQSSPSRGSKVRYLGVGCTPSARAMQIYNTPGNLRENIHSS
jgi:hypothetical protein